MHKRTVLAAAVLTVLASACQLGNPEPRVPQIATGTSHRTLLMFGDSLMGQHDVAFPGVLAAHGIDATVIDAHINASGLIGPVGDADSALAWVQEKVAEYPDADPVVLEWAGACAVCGTTRNGITYPAIGDDDAGFYSTWVAHAWEIIDWLHSQGKTVVWVTSPPFGTGEFTVPARVEAAGALSMLDALVIGPRASHTTLDWFTALSDTNKRYATTLWYDNRFNTVRTEDLTHFTLEGATRASKWSVAGLIDLLEQMPEPLRATASLPIGLIEAGDPVRIDPPPGL
jgi:hypothetical protein